MYVVESHSSVVGVAKDRYYLRHPERHQEKDVLKRGDSGSFAAFYQSCFDDVYRAVYAHAGDRDLALDATQEAFSRAFVRWRRLSRHPWAAGWVITTATNLTRRHFRADQRSLASSRGTGASPPPDAQRLDVLDALRRLPSRQRQAAVLFYIHDLSLETVAELMRISQGAVKSHLSRARKAMKEALQMDRRPGK